ncbi:prepilin-type N-terminal cleavage/methylation domain-containing protein [Acinetobacter sp. YH12236]|uniref:prepilin-type N-terminal cleavage/methylation domain-containing protein n=1 Tax=Acinetobacter sp. YH12236 TaxID=2601163 RepID=UPI0015D36158|nr:prepilin-type N-terminal cleavage/methylation domain-containing protein [Acinetobacter sp. YH12236]
MQKKKNGFTLIELMVTIAVLGIIATLAAPNMMTVIYKKQLEISALELAQTLAKTRGAAIALRKDVSLEFKSSSDTGNEFYWLPKYENVKILSKIAPEGILFSPVGLARERKTSIRKSMIANPNYDATLPEDPLSNPKQIPEWEETTDLVFEICHEKVAQVRSIKIYKSGVIGKVEIKPLLGVCQ